MTNENEIKPKKPIWKKWWFWLIAIFVIFILIGSNGEEKKETTLEQQLSQKQEQTQKTTQTENEKDQIAEEQYIEEIVKINQNVSGAMEYISNLCQTKPLPIFWTEEEMFTAAAHTVMIELSYESAQKLDPPDKFKSTHSFFLSGLSKYAEAMPIFRSGVDNLDADEIQQATILIAEGVHLIDKAIQEVNKTH